MEQLVILLVIGAISLVKWLVEKSAEAREQRKAAERFEKAGRPAEESMRPAPPEPNRDEAARRLREALGLPDEEELPPPLPRKEPVILFERPLPEPPPLPSYEDLERRFVESIEEGPVTPPPPVFRPVPPPVLVKEKKPVSRASLDELLRSRDGLRKAILAQEILGPPKGLVF